VQPSGKGVKPILCSCAASSVPVGRSLLPGRSLAGCSPTSLSWRVTRVLAAWVPASLVAKPDDPLALDGKTVPGARTATESGPHLLAFCPQQSQETLLQVAVDEQTNQMAVAQALLPRLPLAGRVCRADALQRKGARASRLVREQQADTVLLVKQNQPSLLADLLTYFADPDARRLQAETWDRHRGRTWGAPPQRKHRATPLSLSTLALSLSSRATHAHQYDQRANSARGGLVF
jgi:hypothetical protein